MIRASPAALREAGFECLTTARPEAFGQVRKAVFAQQANPSWRGVGHVAEDDAVVDAQVLKLVANTQAVRRRLLAVTVTATDKAADSHTPGGSSASSASSSSAAAEAKEQRRGLEQALSTGASQHVVACRLGLKMCGKEPWTPGDQGWSAADADYRAATFRAEDDAALAAGRAAAEGNAAAALGAAAAAGGETFRMASYSK